MSADCPLIETAIPRRVIHRKIRTRIFWRRLAVVFRVLISRWSAASALAGCLLVPGCSSTGLDQASTALPPDSSSSTLASTVAPTTPTSPVSPSPTATPSPTPTRPKPPKPAVPAANRQDTAAGARATAVYWIEALGYAFATGDTKPMRAISFSNCQSCRNYGGDIDELVRMGGVITAVHPFKLERSAVERASKSTATIAVRYLTGQSHVHIPHKLDKTGAAPGQVRGEIDLTWTSGGWKVNDLYT